MSIDRNTFENASEAELAALSVPDRVLGFLAAHDDRAFEALQSGGEWAVGEERTNADLDDIVAEISRLTGWDDLSELGEQALEA